MKTRIMLVDDNAEFTKELSDFLSSSDNYEVVGAASDGMKGLELFNRLKPDVMILDLVMPQMDGFSVLERVVKGGSKIIVVSALSQDTFVAKAMSLGADYYMMKPVSLSNLKERIDETLAPKTVKPVTVTKLVRNNSLEEKITNIFITVGIPAHIKGYHFLREAIKMAIDNPEIINSITKRLYPEVAGRFDTSPSKVERAIRHAIEVAWNRGKIENINSLFGVRVYNRNEKPTNGEFIALVADKMLLESV
ncbi:MAG: sporulation transcription factor Spo0A [Clostridiales bacterium]|jgi:two-component system response regulator (stage 0 sporulation protein A)|nr:sporulation transcription factor Spo0A [Clostridiales bacterium]